MREDLRGKAGIVVIFYECSQQCRIRACRSHRVDHVVEVADASASRFEGSEEGEVPVIVRSVSLYYINLKSNSHRVIKYAINNVLIRTSEIHIPVEYLTHAVDSSSFVVARPKALLDIPNSIDAETINCEAVFSKDYI